MQYISGKGLANEPTDASFNRIASAQPRHQSIRTSYKNKVRQLNQHKSSSIGINNLSGQRTRSALRSNDTSVSFVKDPNVSISMLSIPNRGSTQQNQAMS